MGGPFRGILPILLLSIVLAIVFQTLSFAQYNLYSINNYSIKQDSLLQPLPTKAMFKSLLIPGWGQYQNKDDIWKTVAFISVEIAGIISSIQLTNKAENIRHDFEKYGDDHWTLERWYNNSRLIFPNNWKNILIGTHKLSLNINGNYYFTDELNDLIETHGWNAISVIRDRDFYENIGKYDQFVGGWSDANTDWYWEEKQLEDSTEIVIKTPLKANYLDQRFESNKMLDRAKFSITALLFNHVISGLEAVLTNQKQSREKLNPTTIETDVSLLYNPYNPGGVGGVALTINF